MVLILVRTTLLGLKMIITECSEKTPLQVTGIIKGMAKMKLLLSLLE